MTVPTFDRARLPGTVAVPPSVEVLAPYVASGVFAASDVHLAASLARLVPGRSTIEILGLALASRAPRHGHVCLTVADLTDGPVGEMPEDAALVWPSADEWTGGLIASPLVAAAEDARTEPLRPLVWDHERLYLQRYWCYEVDVADAVRRRSGPSPLPYGSGEVEAVLDRVFGPDPDAVDRQRRAVRLGLQSGFSCVAGGPGTGKTYTIARLVAADRLLGSEGGGERRVALVAPTGKAAARMDDAVAQQFAELRAAGVLPAGSVPPDPATTVHRLLGAGRRGGYRHHRDEPVPHDLVVVDETSMVSLPLMAALLDALRPEARLVLVGDPDQLASIEAGTVMSDLVGPGSRPGGARAHRPGPRQPSDGPPPPSPAAAAPLAGRVTVLHAVHRFTAESGIGALSRAVQAGDVGGSLEILRSTDSEVVWVDPADADAVDGVVEEAARVGVRQVEAALVGNARGSLEAAGSLKVLAATRRGPLGVSQWTGWLEREVAARVTAFQPGRRWHVGRPVLVTANDPSAHVFNGDTGVVVATPDGLQVVLDAEGTVRMLAPSRLEHTETWWAMTIHKSQGSEYPAVVVSLPPAPSPILTRELLYTAVTRAREHLVVVADEASVRAAIGRPLARASGLGDRLWPT